MKRAISIVLLLVASVAQAASIRGSDPGVNGLRERTIGSRTIGSPSRELALSIPFSSWGGMIDEDAGTVAHVVWNGTALVDARNTWVQNGTVPQNVETPLYPSGFTGAQRKGAGPFSDANKYVLGSGSDVLDFAGDFTICVAFFAVDSAGSRWLLGNGNSAGTSGGYDLAMTSGETFGIFSRNVGGTSATAQATVGAANIGCVGRSGATISSKVNLGTTVNGAAGTWVAGTSFAATIGNKADGVSGGADPIIEIYATSTPFNEANVTRIQRRFFGMLGAHDEVVSITRASTATYTTPTGRIWTAPAGVLRIGCEDAAAAKCGAQMEIARTNLTMHSEDLTNAAWTIPASATVVADQCVFPTAQTTMESVTSTVATETVTQAETVTSSVGPHSVSGYIVATSGTQTGSVGMTFGAGNATGCTCARSDGGSCTASTTGATGFAFASVTTTPIRLMLTCSTTVATTAVTTFVTGGQFNTSTGTICAGGMQFEQAPASYATSYIPTTTLAVTRNVDAVTVANPLSNADGTNWSIEGVYSPENFRSWNDPANSLRLWSFGTNGAANSVRLYSTITTGLEIDTFDATTTLRQRNGNHGFAAGTTHRVSAGSAPPTLFIDGVSLGTLSGAGTGIITTMPATIGIGGEVAVPFGGYIRDFQVWRRPAR